MTHNDYTQITELPGSLLSPDQIHRFAHRYGYAQMLACDKRVLEVACGSGSALNYLAQSAAHVVGLDCSGGVLIQTQQDTFEPLIQGDAQWLPFAAQQFDLLLCFEAIYYLDDYRHFLAECRRVVRPGGRVLICQSNPNWPNFAPGALTTHYPSLPELAKSLTQAGFSAVHCFGVLPITDSDARQKAMNVLRRIVVKSGILPWLGPLKTHLQRMSYGELHPLPLSIDAAWIARWQPEHDLSPLSPTQPDRIHRVIYVEGIN